MLKRLEVFFPPQVFLDVDLVIQRLVLPLYLDRYGEPLRSFSCFYPVAITPSVLVELNIVIDDKDIARSHELKEPKPGQVSGLYYCYSLHDLLLSGLLRFLQDLPVIVLP